MAKIQDCFHSASQWLNSSGDFIFDVLDSPRTLALAQDANRMCGRLDSDNDLFETLNDSGTKSLCPRIPSIPTYGSVYQSKHVTYVSRVLESVFGSIL